MCRAGSRPIIWLSKPPTIIGSPPWNRGAARPPRQLSDRRSPHASVPGALTCGSFFHCRCPPDASIPCFVDPSCFISNPQSAVPNLQSAISPAANHAGDLRLRRERIPVTEPSAQLSDLCKHHVRVYTELAVSGIALAFTGANRSNSCSVGSQWTHHG